MMNLRSSSSSVASVARLFVLALLVVSPSPAASAGEPSTPLPEALRPLARVLEDPEADWGERWAEWKRAAEAMKHDPGLRDSYERHLQAQAAQGLRRHELPATGIVLGLVAGLINWGGLAYCIRLAAASNRRGRVRTP